MTKEPEINSRIGRYFLTTIAGTYISWHSISVLGWRPVLACTASIGTALVLVMVAMWIGGMRFSLKRGKEELLTDSKS